MDRIHLDSPSYGLICLISIGLILYFTYIFIFIRNRPSSTVYIYFSQLILFLCLLSSLTYLFHPTLSICSIQTLTFQILPFCFLLGLNINFLCEWLIKLTKLSSKSWLILLCTFFLFFLLILIQTAILLIWFYYQNQSYNENYCLRPYFLSSLILNFFLLIIYFIQTTIKIYFNKQLQNLIYFLTSLFALIVMIIWIYLYISFSKKTYLLAYGILSFVYVFLGPFLYGQIFYRKSSRNQINRMNFQCLSLTKDQQREYMAAYIKRNLAVSCENLTRHSTLSTESLCPTLISTISSEYPLNEVNNSQILTCEY